MRSPSPSTGKGSAAFSSPIDQDHLAGERCQSRRHHGIATCSCHRRVGRRTFRDLRQILCRCDADFEAITRCSGGSRRTTKTAVRDLRRPVAAFVAPLESHMSRTRSTNRTRPGKAGSNCDKPEAIIYIYISDLGGGGWGGIRTLDTASRMPVFKTGAFNRSATHPSSCRI